MVLDIIWWLINSIILIVVYVLCIPICIVTGNESILEGAMATYDLIVSYPSKIILKTSANDSTIKDAKEVLFGHKDEKS